MWLESNKKGGKNEEVTSDSSNLIMFRGAHYKNTLHCTTCNIADAGPLTPDYTVLDYKGS